MLSATPSQAPNSVDLSSSSITPGKRRDSISTVGILFANDAGRFAHCKRFPVKQPTLEADLYRTLLR